MDPAAAEKGRDVMIGRDLLEHPDFGNSTGFHATSFPACKGPLSYVEDALQRDIGPLKQAVSSS